MYDSYKFKLGLADFAGDLNHLCVIRFEQLELSLMSQAQILKDRLIFEFGRSFLIGFETLLIESINLYSAFDLNIKYLELNLDNFTLAG